MELRVTVNKVAEFAVTRSENQVLLNSEAQSYQLKKISSDRYLLYLNNKTYAIKLLGTEKNLLSIHMNGQLMELTIKDHMTQLLEQLGMDTETTETIDSIRAPMPGGILEVAVVSGQEVKKGDKLIILEAMKMENVIKAPVDGKVTQVHVKAGDNVEKNQQLVSF